MTGRRADGYHLLDSLVVFACVGDAVSAELAEGLSLVLDGPEAGALAAEPDNLVLRAARALAAGRELGAALRLVKRLPVASGIGGGSSDAAAALRVLARLWRVEADLPALALSLGADVPVCLARSPAVMRGIGEALAPAPRLPRFGLLLANPRVAVETRAVFAARAPGFSAPIAYPEAWSDAAAMARDLAAWRNDLEAPAMALCPVIGQVRAAIAAQPGCLLARMSGSGATCFGLFADAAAAERAAADLPGAWWRWGGAAP